MGLICFGMGGKGVLLWSLIGFVNLLGRDAEIFGVCLCLLNGGVMMEFFF